MLLLGVLPWTVQAGAAGSDGEAAMPASAASAASAPAARLRARSGEAAAPDRLGPQDPMDMLRERLAQRLGSVKSPDPANPRLLRVEGKAGDAVPAAAARAEAAASAPPARSPRPRHAAGPSIHAGHAADWGYGGAADPAAWARLAPEFAACAHGRRQSPIDIHDGIKVDLEPIQFGYQPGAFRVIDNGHTVQVNVAPGNAIEVGGRRYELVQFHFHRPSEERVDGKQYDMVVHLVHRDAEGRLAVVAVLLQSGGAHAAVQAVWNNLPLEKGEEVVARGTLDPALLLPASRGYYTYMGSLTTPPCSEGVLWLVMKQPVPVSPEQIGIFARLYPMNARPVQPAGERLIKESN